MTPITGFGLFWEMFSVLAVSADATTSLQRLFDYSSKDYGSLGSLFSRRVPPSFHPVKIKFPDADSWHSKDVSPVHQQSPREAPTVPKDIFFQSPLGWCTPVLFPIGIAVVQPAK
ncbi:MAG: hypothetical protein N839_0012770 [Desulfofustis sp. PB-SRB1]|nr:hypothetical protein [Desulfofustis sp. PB-SRB1]